MFQVVGGELFIMIVIYIFMMDIMYSVKLELFDPEDCIDRA